MKLRNSIALLLALCILFALAACGEQMNTPSDSPAQNQPNTPTDSDDKTPVSSTEKFTFIVSSFAGDGDTAAQFMSAACDRISERTGGNISFTKYLNGELGTPTDILEMVRAGTVDIAQLSASFASDTDYPVSKLVTMPFYVADTYTSTDILYALKDAGLLNEYEGDTHLLYINGIDGDYLISTKAKVASVADLKGKLVRAQGGGVDTMIALGASPTTIASSELYSSLERGVIDGAITGSTNIYNTKLYETCSYLLDYPLSNGSQYVVMNAAKWQALPDDYKAIIAEEMEAAKEAHVKWMYDECHKDIALMGDAGVTITEMTDENLKEFQEISVPVIEAYREWLGGQGYDAEEVFRIAEEIIAAAGN